MSPDPTSRSAPLDADLILVGGGLANGLIAWCLHQTLPDLRVLVLEAGPALGGQHTWSYHDSDLDAGQRSRIAALTSHRWQAYDVVFPTTRRRFHGGYVSITSDDFDARLRQTLPASSIRLGARAVDVRPDAVRLDDGTTLRARAVIDARGPSATSSHLTLGWQKFLGLELQLTAPHGLTCPTLMDACVDQLDGYRFVYLLPFAPDRVLVEDTYYADSTELETEQLRARIASYAARRGWQVREVVREEHGVLPILLEGEPEKLWDEAAGVSRAGVAAALFHPTTGYSLPEALRLAEKIERFLARRRTDFDAPMLFDVVRTHAMRRWRAGAYFRLLNRLLFRAADPAQRWRVMQRFYTLSEPLIARFYAGRLRWRDQLRIVVGRPPVPMGAAIRVALNVDPASSLAARAPK